MRHRITWRLRALVTTLALLSGATTPALAGPITTFLDAPTGLSPLESNGSAILADDFIPAHTGWLHNAIWWGSRPPNDSHWVVAFYANSAGRPAGDNPIGDALARFEFDVPGAFGERDFSLGPDLEIWRFAIGLPEQLELIAGTEYWFSVGNLAPDWRWAESGGMPSVGTENFSAQQTDRSEQPGGPGCLDPVIPANGAPLACYGPWRDTSSNFAFQISVPEPGSLPLAGLALLLLAPWTPRPR